MKRSDTHYLYAMVFAVLTAISVGAAIATYPAVFVAATLWGLLCIANLFRYAVFAMKDK